MTSNRQANDAKEPECLRILTDRKYLHAGDLFIKRTLRVRERQIDIFGETIVPSETFVPRWTNEIAALRFVKEHTNIPIPKFHAAYHDDGSFHFVTEFVEGVEMSELLPEQKEVVMRQVEKHLAELHSCRSVTFGGPWNGLVFAPYRAFWRWSPYMVYDVREDFEEGTRMKYVFCHNDLSQNNIIVDPGTLEIKAIVDWEFAGFYPEWFERDYWKRDGPSIPMEGEEDDTLKLKTWLLERCVAATWGAVKK
ncbi:MAG: hypothetical protein M4579_005313 [Chaenotheca gracillima]|nr:MAG: hypothetical protein M4579_005313 [Chaenotheca gracillima]